MLPYSALVSAVHLMYRRRSDGFLLRRSSWLFSGLC